MNMHTIANAAGSGSNELHPDGTDRRTSNNEEARHG